MENDFESHLVFKKMGYRSSQKEQKMNIDWNQFRKWMVESGNGTIGEILSRHEICQKAFQHLDKDEDWDIT